MGDRENGGTGFGQLTRGVTGVLNTGMVLRGSGSGSAGQCGSVGWNGSAGVLGCVRARGNGNGVMCRATG
jgi:hypothetical protein